MQQQLSMSFRLQRQRGTLPSHVNPWLGFFLVMSLGAWFRMQRPEAAAPPSIPAALPPEPAARALPPVVPEEAALAPMPVASRPIPAADAPTPPKKQRLKTASIPYTFLFEGRAMSGDEPCPNTHILIRLQEGDRIRVARGMTDAVGSYSIPLTFELTPKASVDWTLEANRKEYQSLEMSGRHIAITGDTSVTIERSINLALR